MEHKTIKEGQAAEPLACGCPGSHVHVITHPETRREDIPFHAASELQQWPVQIKLVPIDAAFFDNAHLLIVADCAAYACGDFHNRFMKNKITIIGCPKLDDLDYSEKLSEIISKNNIKSMTVVRMEVPCCGGMDQAAITALKNSGKVMPWQVVTLSTGGEVL